MREDKIASIREEAGVEAEAEAEQLGLLKSYAESAMLLERCWLMEEAEHAGVSVSAQFSSAPVSSPSSPSSSLSPPVVPVPTPNSRLNQIPLSLPTLEGKAMEENGMPLSHFSI